MNDFETIKMLELLSQQREDKQIEDKWLVFIAEKGKNNCVECSRYHKKRFRESDSDRPALPIHSNCRCKYEKFSSPNTKQSTPTKSVTIRIDKSPGLGGIRASGIDDMLTKIENVYPEGGITELIISNHSGLEGFFSMGNSDSLAYISSNQLNRLRKLLSADAIIDIRMCFAAGGDDGAMITQQLADNLNVVIKGYDSPVSPFGTQASHYFKGNNVPVFFPQLKVKYFFPRKKLTLIPIPIY